MMSLLRTFILLGLAVVIASPSQVAIAIDYNSSTEHLLPYYREGSTLANSSCQSSINLVGDGNEEKAFSYFLGKQLSAEQSAGIVGNLIAESGVDPTRKQNGGGPGRGIAQWEIGSASGRWEILLSFAAANNLDELELGTQLEYLWFEFTGEPQTDGVAGGAEAAAYRDLITQTTVAGAAESFMTKFERPRDQSQAKINYRASLAQAVFDKFAGSASSVGSTLVGGGRCSTLAQGSCPEGPAPFSEIIEVDDAVGGKVTVHSCIADSVRALYEYAKTEGVPLGGYGWRDNEKQIELRISHCGTSDYDIYEKPSGECSPPTAVPGRSRHERGLAIDFRYNNGGIGYRTHPGYIWLNENAARYGLINLPSEPWHWSTDGK